MAVIKYTSKDRDLLARLMRAEALGEGNLGMLMVGNVCINRTLCRCFDFKNVSCIQDMVYQNPGGFSGINSPLFFSNPNSKERELADRVLNGEYYHPATNSLWFYAPKKGEKCRDTWYNQKNAGKYKNHCFYEPDTEKCSKIH